MCIIRNIMKNINLFIKKNLIGLLKFKFEEFIPNSSGNLFQINELIEKNIVNTNKVLADICNDLNEFEITQLDDLKYEKSFAEKLKINFNIHNSDKTTHGYHILYSYIFKKLTANPCIFEIGIGSNNTEVVSNMGNKGFPGASLHAFSNVFPKAKLYGADIDKDILFNTNNIECYFLDQNNYETFLTKEIQNINFDLLIDDGLHMQSSNLNTLRFFINSKSDKNKILIIEDVSHNALNTWFIVKHALGKEFKLEIIECFDNYAVLVSNF